MKRPTSVLSPPLSALPQLLPAQTWISNASSNLGTAANWSASVVPGANADLLFQNVNPLGQTATNDLGAYTARTLTFDTWEGFATDSQQFTLTNASGSFPL